MLPQDNRASPRVRNVITGPAVMMPSGAWNQVLRYNLVTNRSLGHLPRFHGVNDAKLHSLFPTRIGLGVE